MRHTKGPWSAVYRPAMNLAGVHIRTTQGTIEVGYCNSSDNETPEHDAKLIAAAPEMLQCLKDILSEASNPTMTEQDLKDYLKQVIRKAEGQL